MLRGLFHWVVSIPTIYDFVQFLSGGNKIKEKLTSYLSNVGESSLLDIGGGTGRVIPLLSKKDKYVCLDNDLIKLQSLRKKFPGTAVVLADAANLPFCSGAIDDSMLALVSHHLPDPIFSETLKETARVCKRYLIFLDALNKPNRTISNLLWRYDRGRFPRFESELFDEIERNYLIQNVEYLSIFHKYVLILAKNNHIS